MALNFHPPAGSIVVCDFTVLKTPEITKRRPVVVIAPPFKTRDNLCTVVPLTTTVPKKIHPYHHKLFFNPRLPEPYTEPCAWVLGDMIYTVCFERLKLILVGKDDNGKRIYYNHVISEFDMKHIRMCVLNGLGLGSLTQHL